MGRHVGRAADPYKNRTDAGRVADPNGQNADEIVIRLGRPVGVALIFSFPSPCIFSTAQLSMPSLSPFLFSTTTSRKCGAVVMRWSCNQRRAGAAIDGALELRRCLAAAMRWCCGRRRAQLPYIQRARSLPPPLVSLRLAGATLVPVATTGILICWKQPHFLLQPLSFAFAGRTPNFAFLLSVAFCFAGSGSIF